VAATALDSGGVSYEEFVRLHAEEFQRYLHTVLGHEVEGRGGRVAIEDTLQEGLLRIHAEWPELQQAGDLERDRRLYRCLRDAAGEALRSEHGRRDDRGERPRIVTFDFGALRDSSDVQSMAERELTAAVLGTMARDLAADQRDSDARAMLSRAVLLAGLRALSEREAVVLIAADYLEQNQHQLADKLGLSFEALRQTLFGARKIFYSLIRHAAGIELEEEERARLAAYLAGELTGAEKREARRHLRHCQACQALQREQRVFGRDAFGLLSPLPFIFGAKVLVKRSGAKGAVLGSGGGASGLLGQAGAAKALAVVVGVLGTGVGASAWLAERHEQPLRHDQIAPAPAVLTPAGGMRRPALPSSQSAQHKSTKTTKKSTSAKHHRASSTTGSTNTTTQSSTPSTAASSPPAGNGQTAPATSSSSSGSSGSKPGGGEFFGGP
jgi:DNA-directed RNA polymerase specialized sigma24 family protein